MRIIIALILAGAIVVSLLWYFRSEGPDAAARPAPSGLGQPGKAERDAVDASDRRAVVVEEADMPQTFAADGETPMVDGIPMIRAETRDGEVIWIPPAPGASSPRPDAAEEDADWALPGPEAD